MAEGLEIVFGPAKRNLQLYVEVEVEVVFKEVKRKRCIGNKSLR